MILTWHQGNFVFIEKTDKITIIGLVLTWQWDECQRCDINLAFDVTIFNKKARGKIIVRGVIFNLTMKWC